MQEKSWSGKLERGARRFDGASSVLEQGLMEPGCLLQTSIVPAQHRLEAAPCFIPSARALPWCVGKAPSLVVATPSFLLMAMQAGKDPAVKPPTCCHFPAQVQAQSQLGHVACLHGPCHGGSSHAHGTSKLGTRAGIPWLSVESSGYTSVEYSIMLEKKGERTGERELPGLGGDGEVWEHLEGNRASCQE